MGRRMGYAGLVVVGLCGMLLVGAAQLGKVSLFREHLYGTRFYCGSSGGPTGCAVTAGRTYEIPVVARTYRTVVELPFDASSTECVRSGFALPMGYDGGPVNVCPAWFSRSTTSGDVRWRFDYSAKVDGDSPDEAVTQRSFSITVPASATYTMRRRCDRIESFPGGPANVDVTFCRIGGSTLDTMSGDAVLEAVTIESFE